MGSFLILFFLKWSILFVFVLICNVGKTTYMETRFNCGKVSMLHIDKVVMTSLGVPLSIGIPQSIGVNTLVMALSCYHLIVGIIYKVYVLGTIAWLLEP